MKNRLLLLALALAWAVSALPAQDDEGVVLYRDTNFRGRSEVIQESDPDLTDNRIGNDSLSSVRVPPGYVVTLFEHTGYRGRALVLRSDEANLARTTLGNDVASSIRIERERVQYRPGNRRDRWRDREPRPDPVSREGVTLFQHAGFKGRSEVFYESDPDLSDNPIGNDRVSSVRVPQGYIVTLYQHTNYRGRAVVLKADQWSLSRTEVGNDKVSSIRVEREGGFDRPRRETRQPGVTLFQHAGFKGRSEVFYESDPDLTDNPIGNDRISSVRVPPGYVVTLYQHTRYRGRKTELRADAESLRRTAVGNDNVSSIKIEFVGRRRR